jgi:probable rRNA maturation factor
MIEIDLVKNIDCEFTGKDFSYIAKLFLKYDKENFNKLSNGKPGIITVVLCDDLEIQEFNREIRGKDTATDVLSFVYFEKLLNKNNEHEKTFFGDILISIETAKRQAENGLRQEVLKLFSHGLLHIFGYDHNNDEEEKKMEKLSEKILKGL